MQEWKMEYDNMGSLKMVNHTAMVGHGPWMAADMRGIGWGAKSMGKVVAYTHQATDIKVIITSI